jgi:hypothetical protein
MISRQRRFPPRPAARALGDAERFTAASRSELSGLIRVVLRRVDLRDGRVVALISSSKLLFRAARAASLCAAGLGTRSLRRPRAAALFPAEVCPVRFARPA